MVYTSHLFNHAKYKSTYKKSVLFISNLTISILFNLIERERKVLFMFVTYYHIGPVGAVLYNFEDGKDMLMGIKERWFVAKSSPSPSTGPQVDHTFQKGSYC